MPLVAVARLESGHTPSRNHADYWNGGIPWIGIRDAKRHNYGWIDSTEQTVSAKGLANSSARLLPAGTVCLSRTASVGYVTIMKRTMATSQDFVNWVCGDRLLPEYLMQLLRCEVPVLKRFSKGAVHQTIYFPEVKAFHISLPPVDEQKRIVAKVDQLMALCDDLEARQARKREIGTCLTKSALEALTTAESRAEFDAAWKRVVDNFDMLFDRTEKVSVLRRTVVELAVRGCLVEQHADDEDAESLLCRIAAERTAATANGMRVPSPSPIEQADGPYPIPLRWRWVRWGHLALGSDSGWSPQCESRPRDGDEWGVVKVSAVSWNEFKPEENKALPAHESGRDGCAIRAGDFLMSRANTAELVGRSVVVDVEPVRLMMSDKIVRCTFAEPVNKRYVNLFNQTSSARAHYIANASGTSDSMKNISRDVVFLMPVALPPLAEQDRIVAKVQQLMQICDDLEARLCRAEDRATKLVEAAVQELVA